MKTKFLFAGLLIVALAPACKKDKKLSDTDENFMKNAAYANYNEIDAGQLAGTQATDSAVRSFAHMMVAEHQTALNELKSLAQDKDIALPTGPDAAHIAAKQQLQQLSGHAFDSAYIHMQVTDHQTTVNLFQGEINSGENEDVQNYARKYLPHIQMHLNMADTIADRF